MSLIKFAKKFMRRPLEPYQKKILKKIEAFEAGDRVMLNPFRRSKADSDFCKILRRLEMLKPTIEGCCKHGELLDKFYLEEDLLEDEEDALEDLPENPPIEVYQKDCDYLEISTKCGLRWNGELIDERETKITLNLNEREAQILLDFIQNPITENEADETSIFRGKVWEKLTAFGLKPA